MFEFMVGVLLTAAGAIGCYFYNTWPEKEYSAIIGNKLYSTKCAKLLFNNVYARLYKTPKGAYFILAYNDYAGSDHIISVPPEQAIKHLEDWRTADNKDEIHGLLLMEFDKLDDIERA